MARSWRPWTRRSGSCSICSPLAPEACARYRDPVLALIGIVLLVLGWVLAFAGVHPPILEPSATLAERGFGLSDDPTVVELALRWTMLLPAGLWLLVVSAIAMGFVGGPGLRAQCPTYRAPGIGLAVGFAAIVMTVVGMPLTGIVPVVVVGAVHLAINAVQRVRGGASREAGLASVFDLALAISLAGTLGAYAAT